ncbi:YciI family protein [Methylobacterium sp. 1030]|uniref:YciI family protein n=1 Tax=Methylobacterium sp. 1030 TaxID=3156404 RepID=UPI00339520BE
MQFVIVARDAPNALEHRLAARGTHMEGIRARKQVGEIIDGGAILDEDGRMVGSIVMCEFPDRAGLDAYLADEIYARQRVWDDIQIYPFHRVDWSALMVQTV